MKRVAKQLISVLYLLNILVTYAPLVAHDTVRVST